MKTKTSIFVTAHRLFRLAVPIAFFLVAVCVLAPSRALAQIQFPTGTGLSETPITSILTNFMNWLLGIFGFIAVIGFVISGIQYLTAAGDDAQIETAKRNLKYSIIGVIVALSGAVIIFAIDNVLNGTAQF